MPPYNETLTHWHTSMFLYMPPYNEIVGDKVVLSNVDARAGTGGVTSLALDKCWR